MPFIPYEGPRIIPNTVDVTTHWTFQGNQCENVYQMKYTTVPTKAQLDQLASDFGQEIFTLIRPRLSTAVQWVDVVAKDIGAAGRAQGSYTFFGGSNGTNTSDPTAANTAIHALLRTAKTGRRFKGGKSYSGFTESDITGNTIGSAILAFIGNLALALLHSYVSGLFLPAVGSLPKMSAPGVVLNAAESNAITNVSAVDANVDSQKTRLNNRGR